MIDTVMNPLLLRSVLLIACAVFAVAAAPAMIARPAEARATKFTLKNGMDVIVIPDHRAPVVTHMVWYRVGSADELPGQSGIAHFLEHLMFKGTKKIAPGQFSKIVARNGGEDNAFTADDATAYHQRVAKDRLPLVMEMEADRMTNLQLHEKDVLTERMVVLEERRSRVDAKPSSILNEQMMAALYQSHPYGIPVIGWEHEIRKLDLKQAVDFYKRYYAPNNAMLIVAGDVTPNEVRKLAEKTYGRVKPHASRVRADRPLEPKHYAPVRVELEDARAGQATVQRLYIAPSYSRAEPGEAEALDLLMRIAGDGPTSRLYKKLVVELKVAAAAGGWYSGSGLDSSRVGVYGIAAGGVPVEKVEQAIDEVIDDLRENGVTKAELQRAKNAHLAEFIYESDSQSTLARRYGWALASGRTIKDIEEWPARLEKVTLEDIARVARTYLDITQSATGVLVPQAAKTPSGKKGADDARKS